MTKTLIAGFTALWLVGCAQMAPPPAVPNVAPAQVEVTWLGQAAFKIVTPGGKVIVTDPWLRTNPLAPAEYKKL